ncbi:NAD(P)/FAD-dependent oxidoreductase [Tumebacillus sp. ITR2]|uniref:NAD(P)/FAD-dependent oxidoreductase n=2 Tax=Tumebacillus amylolyticus TaxID=2801339 RepID=A0ABS1J9T1_9BACL|nr:NAD(P)/FAD-dependent oxidoreductase [Tumebacillus amylolyticus]MBL0387037.1 NAD(P)/FAD-dependent oxidoreductase [Tumebacillus amylolyticus]
MRSEIHTQVCVLGGGPAGASVACLLSKAGVRNVLVDDGAGRAVLWKVGEGLPPSSRRVLQMLGVWEEFLSDGHLASFGNRSIWGSSVAVEHDFLLDPHGNGWHLDRVKFDHMMRTAACEAGSLCLSGSRVKTFQKNESTWQLETDTDSIRADVVVDATGRTAWWARQMGVERAAQDQLVGIATVVESEEANADRDSFTEIEAVENGWWYTAQVPGGKRVVAFLSDGDLPQTKAAREADVWRSGLARTTRIGKLIQRYSYQLTEAPRIFIANSSHLQQVQGAGWLAVGDAAAAYDPLSSQGILMAIGTAIEASHAIQEGTPASFAAYEEFVHRTYRHYLDARSHFYAMEQRWRTHSFWARRIPAEGKG